MMAGTSLVSSFQYPQTGSNLCNRSQAYQRRVVQKLSVPSNRVEPLQRSTVSRRLSVLAPFSTLKPGRTSATPLEQVTRPARENFQYPQTGSNLCNAGIIYPPIIYLQLSRPENRLERQECRFRWPP